MKKKKQSCGNTFTRPDIEAVVQVFGMHLRGGDPRMVATSEAGLNVYRKFVGMKRRLDAKAGA